MTVKDNLAAVINKVEHGKIHFEKNIEDGDWKCTIITEDNKQVEGV